MNDAITDNDLKDLRRQLNADFKLHLGTLYEKFSGDLSLLGEQLTAINKRLTVVEGKVDVAIDAIADLKVEATTRRERLLRLENRVSTLESS